MAAKCGAGEKPAGKRLATDTRHRVDTDQEVKGLLLQDGGKERGPAILVESDDLQAVVTELNSQWWSFDGLPWTEEKLRKLRKKYLNR